MELFGAQGYERTSTREIAARAGVNPPALQYYFDSKEGLYLACAEYMVARGRELLEPVLVEARGHLERASEVDDLIEAVCLVHDRIADLLLISSELDAWSRFMAWEESDIGGAPAIACQVIEQGVKQEIRGVLCELIGRITGKSADDPETLVRMLTLGGQVSVFHLGRAKYEMRVSPLGWPLLDEDGVARIRAIVRQQTKAALRAAAVKPPKGRRPDER